MSIRSTRVKSLALAGVFLFVPLSSALAASVNQLVVFGDSLSDNGNAAAALGGHFAYNGNTNYAPNAATDGPNTTPPVPAGGPLGLWVDQFAAKVNLPDPQPIVSFTNGAVTPNYTGSNFAVASAQTGTNPAFNLATFTTNPAVPYVTDQLSLFNAFNAHNGTTANPGALYTFWAGADDIANLNSPITAANHIMQNIQTLAGEGGKYFLWVNMPDLGLFPGAGAAAPIATAASLLFDQQFEADVALLKGQGITVVPVDVYSLFNQIAANKTLNTTTPAQGLAGVNPDDYAFWDTLHPTTEMDSFIASVAAKDLTAADITAAPEPGSIALAALGLLALAALTIRPRRTS